MVSEILSLLFGLGTGVLTGLFFERRALRAAETQNVELREELETLKATLYSLGGSTSSASAAAVAPPDLAHQVARWAATSQDSSGRVDRRGLLAHFLQDGHQPHHVDAAIAALCARGTAQDEGRWLRMG